MGAMGEAIVAYAQSLIDETDGSIEDLEKAMAVSQDTKFIPMDSCVSHSYYNTQTRQ